MTKTFEQIKNIAIVAHVDHGKTTLVDVLLKQSGTFDPRQEVTERVMDSGELEKERGITITAKNCSFVWKNTKINLLDTPGHADFGGEVERSLMMVDGILLLVDASEGPLPQTRFVLQKAMERKLKIAVVINKIDRADERIVEVKHDVENLLLDLATMLDISDFDLDTPFLYASARNGWATHDPKVVRSDLHPILDLMASDYYPTPVISSGPELQLLITNLSYSSYLGQLVVGRIQRGSVKKNGSYIWCDEARKDKSFKVTAVQIYDGLGTVEVDKAEAGEIVIIAGLEDGKIGDTICSAEKIDPLPRVMVEPPTVSINVSVSTSPLSGQEGEYLTSRKLEEFLQKASRLNVALQYAPTVDPKVYTLKGRGELQLAIVFEELRRSGYEFMVSRPQVITKKNENGETEEPFELLVVDTPANAIGAITQEISNRKGIMKNMLSLSETRTRVEFEIPSRGLIGYRSKFLTDTKGEGLMSSQFLGYRPFLGEMLARINGAIISDRLGVCTPYALFNLLSSGKQFVIPGDKVYEGMVIGEHTRINDINVNCVREKHLSSVRTAGKDENVILPPIPPRTLEWAMDWIDHDEWVEVTPQNVRVRKKEMSQNKRSVVRSNN